MPKLLSQLKYIVPLFLFVSLVPFTFYVLPAVIKVNQVICESQFGPCPDDINLELNETKGQSLNSSKKNISDFLSQLSEVKRFSARFQLPDKIKVDLILKKGIVGLYNGQGQLALVDGEGMVLSYTRESLLPMLKIDGKPPGVGEKVDKDTFFALRLLTYVSEIFGVKEGLLENDAVTFPVKEGPKVIFPLEGDQKALVGGLILIENELNKDRALTKMKDEGAQVCKEGCIVDLRYKNPVVRI